MKDRQLERFCFVVIFLLMTVSLLLMLVGMIPFLEAVIFIAFGGFVLQRLELE